MKTYTITTMLTMMLNAEGGAEDQRQALDDIVTWLARAAKQNPISFARTIRTAIAYYPVLTRAEP